MSSTLSLGGTTSLVNDNLITVEKNGKIVPLVCSKNAVVTGDEKSGKIKINFTENPLKIGKVSKQRIVIVTSSQVFLYGHKSYCHFATWNSKTPITAATSHEDISRVFFGHEDGRIRIMKITGSGFASDVTLDSSSSKKVIILLLIIQLFILEGLLDYGHGLRWQNSCRCR